MRCPFCQNPDTQVIDSRAPEEGYAIRRRRKCPACGKRFTTFERAHLPIPAVVKRNGQRTDYSYRLSKNLFSNRVRAVIGGKFSTDADPSQNLKENLIDDISLEYMLTKRDNMYLKVFRHTGYESILEGEITETGVGFVIRKKLLRLGDLFKSTKPKAKKQKRDEAGTH